MTTRLPLLLAALLASASARASTFVSRAEPMPQPVASGEVQTVALFAGQSNMNQLGTAHVATLPGDPAQNGAASCYVTAAAPAGTSATAGTLTCPALASGIIFPGQLVGGAGVPAGLVVTGSNAGGNLPGVTGTGGAGTYAVSGNMAVGSAAAPVAMTFTMPDAGGGGTLNNRCYIWVPASSGNWGSGQWAVLNPKVNSDGQGGAGMFGPETGYCYWWTQANPGRTLYIVKVSAGGASLANKASGNDYSPAFNGSGGVGAYAQLRAAVPAALAALSSQFGITSYAVRTIVWVQGEQDSQDYADGFPNVPFSSSGNAATYAPTPNVYLANLSEFVNRFAVPAPVSASFTGSIAGTVLTVSAVANGMIRQYQALSGAGILANSFVGTQIDGAAGGAGRYNLVVNQAVPSGTVTSSSGAVTSRGKISGSYFLADCTDHVKTRCTSSVSGGAFAIGNALSGTGVLPGTTITALDAAGHVADGLYQVNVVQNVPSEAMTASLAGWGTGADSARFVLSRTAGAAASGVGVAQSTVNDAGGLALATTTISVDDRPTDSSSSIHYDGRFMMEFGRRLFQASIGACDYHSPTC